MQRLALLATPLTLLAFTVACNQEQATERTPPPESANGTQYLLTAEPQDAKNVIALRKDAQNDEAVTVVGRIGGSRDPWIQGRAAFSIVDLSLKACSDIEGDNCKIPWDYCCETDLLPNATVLVKVVDDAGKLIDTDSRQLLSVKELDTVVVNGTAKRDDAGNLTVLATNLFVKPSR